MFRKLHIQMTLFSTLITSTILVIMALTCLFMAENNARENAYISFQNNVNSSVSHLESQTLITHQWLSKTKAAYGIQLEIKDNGTPLYFQELHSSEKYREALLNAADISINSFGIDPDATGTSSAFTKCEFFRMDGYYAAVSLIPRDTGIISAVMLYPLDSLNRQLTSQRIFFAALVSASFIALGIFSWFFTKKLLLPIEENRKNQTEFIASASHELRSPLTVILSCISAMEQDSSSDHSHYISVIQREGNRMSRLINDMLSLANADNHSWNISLAPCEMDTLLLDTYEAYEPLMKEKQLRFSISLPDEVLPVFMCDSSRISQVLGILLDNAISYVPRGGNISLGLNLHRKGCSITVTDNGPGIPDARKQAIFRRFFRVDSSRNEKQHFGLGLCIAQEIVLLHKGTITVTDAPGGGAVFTVFLPC